MCNGIAAWFDRLTMSGEGWRWVFRPHPNPLPEGEGKGRFFDGLRMRGGGGFRLPKWY